MTAEQKARTKQGRAFATRVTIVGVAAAVVQPLDMETPSHAGDTEGASAIPILLGLTDLFCKLFEHK